MFKPELWQSHNEYRTLVTKIGRRLSRNNPKYSFDSYEEEYQKLLNLNLDPLARFIPDFYSNGGASRNTSGPDPAFPDPFCIAF